MLFSSLTLKFFFQGLLLTIIGKNKVKHVYTFGLELEDSLHSVLKVCNLAKLHNLGTVMMCLFL